MSGRDGKQSLARARGRPTKLTPAVVELVAAAVRAGHTFTAAAKLAGVSPSTFRRWRERAEKAKSGVFLELRLALEQSEADFLADAMEQLQRAAFLPQVEVTVEQYQDSFGNRHQKVVRKVKPPAWQALFKLLERRFPEQFGTQRMRRLLAPPPEKEKDAEPVEDENVIALKRKYLGGGGK